MTENMNGPTIWFFDTAIDVTIEQKSPVHCVGSSHFCSTCDDETVEEAPGTRLSRLSCMLQCTIATRYLINSATIMLANLFEDS